MKCVGVMYLNGGKGKKQAAREVGAFRALHCAVYAFERRLYENLHKDIRKLEMHVFYGYTVRMGGHPDIIIKCDDEGRTVIHRQRLAKTGGDHTWAENNVHVTDAGFMAWAMSRPAPVNA